MNEPEIGVDPNGNASGELATGTEFYGWIDDGDGKFEPPSEKSIFGTTTQSALHVLNNKTYVIGDSKYGGSCKKDTTKYVGMCWCAGNLTVNPTTGKMTCDASALGNSAQTDSFSVDVAIRALSTSQDPKFLCQGKEEHGGEGCSPGYWKQSQHFGSWSAPYTPGTLFGSVFENSFPGKTLLQVLSQGGGGLNALGRQTVAALLNSENPNISFAYTRAQVISMFNAVYPGGNYDTLKNTLETQNTISCPLAKDDEGDNNKREDKKDDNNWHQGNSGFNWRQDWNPFHRS